MENLKMDKEISISWNKEQKKSKAISLFKIEEKMKD
jgi:hypothetical protein